MSRNSRHSPFDELLRECSVPEPSRSVALVPLEQTELRVSSVMLALDNSKGSVSEAADLLQVRPKVLRAFIRKHTELKDLIDDYQLRVREKAERNLADEVLAGDYGASIYYLNRQQRRDEVDPPKKPEITKDLSFDELERLEQIALTNLVDSMIRTNPELTKEKLVALLEDRTKKN